MEKSCVDIRYGIILQSILRLRDMPYGLMVKNIEMFLLTLTEKVEFYSYLM